MKPVIGILANIKFEENDGPHGEYYKINKIYAERIKECDGLALGIFDVSNEILDLFSGFILIGGNRITERHYKIIEYCLKTGKPLLGICNGMQAIVMYDFLYQECLKSNMEPTISNLYKKYDELKEKGIYALEKLENHGAQLSHHEIPFTPENLNKFKHPINIKEGSKLNEFYQETRINVLSMHAYGVHKVTESLEIMALSDDGIVEAVKYKEKPIIGIQFHAEIEENLILFKKLIEKCKSSF